MVRRGFSINHCPVNNLFEATVFIAWSAAAAYLVIGLLPKLRFLGARLQELDDGGQYFPPRQSGEFQVASRRPPDLREGSPEGKRPTIFRFVADRSPFCVVSILLPPPFISACSLEVPVGPRPRRVSRRGAARRRRPAERHELRDASHPRPLRRAGPERPVARGSVPPPGRPRDARPELLRRPLGTDAGATHAVRRVPEDRPRAREGPAGRREGRPRIRPRDGHRPRARVAGRLRGREEGEQPLGCWRSSRSARPASTGARSSRQRSSTRSPRSSSGTRPPSRDCRPREEPAARGVEGVPRRARPRRGRAFLPPASWRRGVACDGTALHGTPKPRDRWKRAIDVTNDALADAVGKIYVERYFRPEYKRDLSEMVAALVAAFGRRIEGLAG